MDCVTTVALVEKERGDERFRKESVRGNLVKVDEKDQELRIADKWYVR